MAIEITRFLSSYRGANSKTTSSIAGIASANIGSKDYYIHPGLEVSITRPQATATVIHPFVIEVAPNEEGYIATSRISTVYELEATPGQAVKSYLQSLVDELVWLQKQKEYLSPAIQEELYILQNYLRLM